MHHSKAILHLQASSFIHRCHTSADVVTQVAVNFDLERAPQPAHRPRIGDAIHLARVNPTSVELGLQRAYQRRNAIPIAKHQAPATEAQRGQMLPQLGKMAPYLAVHRRVL